MSVEGFIVSAIIIVAGFAYVFMPLFKKQVRLSEADKQLKERENLALIYERVILTIRDLDEDFRTGKLNEADYQEDRQRWSERGVQVLQALEAAGGKLETTPEMPRKPVVAEKVNGKDAEQALDDAIEDAIANYVSAMKN